MNPADSRPDAPPVFATPAEARAFALAVALSQAGHFTWNEWSQALGARLAREDASGHGECWVGALEDLLRAKGLLEIAR